MTEQRERQPRRRRARPGADGPWVQAAAFCDVVIRGEDGVLSLIRLVDQVTVSSPPAELPAVVQAGFRTHLVIALKSGGFVGQASIRIRHVPPVGETREFASTAVAFQGGNKGVNLSIDFGLKVTDETFGLHLFEVYADQLLLTKVPLLVLRQAGEPDAGATQSR
jgi:hypothetical protein